MTKIIAGHPVLETIPADRGTGYIPRDYQSFPLGGLKFAHQAPAVRRLTDAEIIELAKEQDAKKSRLTDLCDRIGLQVKDQQRSSYCWAHGAVRACEVAYMLQGGHKFVLSAFDVAASIKGGANQGGSGVEAVQWIAEHGVCTEALHKPMDFSSRRTPEQEANAQLHKILAFDDIDPSDRNLIASYVLLAKTAVTVGIPSMGHEMCVTFIAVQGNDWYPGCDNSWGTSDGVNGRRVVTSRFDEAGAVRMMTPAAA